MAQLNTLIQNSNDLQVIINEALKVDAVALDTEFIWERTYYPRLGLIQLALSDEQCYLIDPLAIDDLQPLGKLLTDRSVIKILHDAPQDLAILQRATGVTPQNIFDTQLAAGFSNLPATLSLCKLVKELLDIDLSKEETRTDWLQRPLTDNQIRYAMDDVRYLRAVRVLLLTRIIGPKIKSWLQEELNLLNNPANYNGLNNTDRYRKIRGAGSLDRQELAILKNLTTWREGTAKKYNRPRNHIIKDTVLLEIAKSKATTIAALEERTTISKKGIGKYGKAINAIVQTTLSQEESSYPELKKPVRLNKGDKQSLEKLNNLITLKCDLLGIAPSLLGNSSELQKLIKILRSKQPLKITHLRQTDGWRKSFLEDFFRQNQKV